MKPSAALDDRLAAALAALVRVHARDGRATVRAVAVELHVGVSTAHELLEDLDVLDLIIGKNRAGALRPRVLYCIDTHEQGAKT